MTRGQRITLIAAAVAVAIVAFVLVSPGGDDTAESPTQPAGGREEPSRRGAAREQPAGPGRADSPRPAGAVEELRIRGGEPAGGVRSIKVEQGQTVRITVTSTDTEEEVHVHGYDLIEPVAPAQPARLTFEADLEGIFEVELEGSHVPIAELEVRP